MNNQKAIIDNQLKMTGTREWAKVNVNIQVGCEHNCRYCYARHNAVTRFKACTAEQWMVPHINKEAVKKGRGKCGGRVMFPSSHDITPLNISYAVIVLKKLLEAGNDVLIVSKPHLKCIKIICGVFAAFKEQITFRFSIGSTDDAVLRFWEPGAPGFEERFESLRFAFEAGFATSVSCEPQLDPYAVYTYAAVSDFITDTFWIGVIRDFDRRVDLSGVTTEQVEQFCRPARRAASEEVVRANYMILKDQPKVRFKDSIREIMERR